MKKNLITLMVAAAMLASCGAVFADEPAEQEVNAGAIESDIMPISATIDEEFTAPVSMPSYISNIVTVTEITDETISTTINAEDAENPENTINYTINDNTIVLGYANGDVKSLKDIKEGDRITVYTNVYSPAPLILPPQYQANVIFVEDHLELDSLRIADVDTYLANGERLVNAANNLELNISDDTEIVDREGKKVDAAELANKDLAVLYTFSTRSIPAQTTPNKIVVLGENEIALAQIEAAKNEANTTPAPTDAPENNGDIEVDLKTINSITVGDKTITNVYSNDSALMIPLREVVETFGFTVEWNDEMKAVILNSGIYSLQINENSYTKGKMMPMQLSCAPEIKDDWTFVPVDYFTEVLEAKINVDVDENGNVKTAAIEYSPVAE